VGGAGEANDRSRTMTGAKPIKRKRSPRPPRPRRPRPPLLSHRVFEKLRNGLIEFKDDDVEHFGLEEWGRFWLVGRAAIQARLDNGEIDAATVEKLVEQLHIDAKIAARRAGEAWIDAKLAEYEVDWKEKGYAPPAEVWGYLHFARLLPGIGGCRRRRRRRYSPRSRPRSRKCPKPKGVRGWSVIFSMVNT
jgi:hypothetical protein